MDKRIEAVYENGVFRPVTLENLNLAEGDHVRLTVGESDPDRSPNILELASQVYDGLSDSDILEVERTAMDRTHFFSGEET